MLLPNEYMLLINLPNEKLALPWIGSREEILSRINWNIVFYIAKAQKLIPAVFLVWGDAMPRNVYSKFSLFFEEWKKEIDAKKVILDKFQQFARQNGIVYLVHKGFSFADYIYDDMYWRYSSDIDLLIKEADIDKYDSFLRKNGFVPNYPNDKNGEQQLLPQPLLKRRVHHEVWNYTSFLDGYKTGLELCMSLHTITNEETSVFFDHTKKLRSIDAVTYSLEYAFLALCENIYNNGEYFNGLVLGEATLRDYVDLYMFISQYGQLLDWGQIDNTPVMDKLLYQVKIVLRNLEYLYGEHISENILQRIDYIPKPPNLMEIEWKSSFTERLFNKKTEQNEFMRYVKKIMYSAEKHTEDVTISERPQFIHNISVSKYPFVVHISAFQQTEILFFNIEINNFLYTLSNDFFIELRILHQSEEDPIFLTIGALFFENGKVIYRKHHTNKFVYSTIWRELKEDFEEERSKLNIQELRNGNYRISVCFNMSEIGMNSTKNLCVQSFLFERIYKDLFYMLSGEDKDLFTFQRLKLMGDNGDNCSE